MNIVKEFLLQVTLIAVPMFVYHTFFDERLKDEKIKNRTKSIIWGFSVILCMSFPVYVSPEFRFDLRSIPILLGTLYCGYKTGIFLGVLAIVYRFSFGIGMGLYHSFFTLVLSLPVVFWYQPAFERASKRKRVNMVVLLSCYYSLVVLGLTYIFNSWVFETPQHLGLMAIYATFLVVFSWVFVTLNENIREMAYLRTELQKTEKLRVLSDLTSVFAHEIRNPIQVSRGFLQMLDEPDLPEHKKRYIQIAIDELDRSNEIIGDFLSFAKPQAEKIETLNVSEQLPRIVGMVQTYAANQNVTIETDLQQSISILANDQKFRQALINILKNGIEAMPDGGILRIRCGKHKDEVVIDVIDQGIGMTREQISRLGSPFYSLKEKGTGIGLMVSYKIIHSYQGKIYVTSEKGKGTTFSIVFPGVS